MHCGFAPGHTWKASFSALEFAHWEVLSSALVTRTMFLRRCTGMRWMGSGMRAGKSRYGRCPLQACSKTRRTSFPVKSGRARLARWPSITTLNAQRRAFYCDPAGQVFPLCRRSFSSQPLSICGAGKCYNAMPYHSIGPMSKIFHIRAVSITPLSLIQSEVLQRYAGLLFIGSYMNILG